MLKVYKKLLYYVPKQKPLAYLAIVLTIITTVATVSAYYYLYEFLKKLIVSNGTINILCLFDCRPFGRRIVFVFHICSSYPYSWIST